LWDVPYDRGSEQDRILVRDESAIAVAEADDLGDAVMLGQFEDEATDDVVEPRAQAAAGHDAHPRRCGFEVQAFSRAARFKGR
jgi:hypothetical protein